MKCERLSSLEILRPAGLPRGALRFEAMTDAQFAAELRTYARRLRQPFADREAIAREMTARAAALVPRPRSTVDVIVVGRRTVVVQKPRSAFGL